MNNPNVLLTADDQPPVEIINAQSHSPLLLSCEHAGRLIPQQLGDLGLASAELDRHIAYDIGAAALARQLSQRLETTLIMQPYSRLVIDCNRPPQASDCISESSDGTTIPANLGLEPDAKQQRITEIHQPFHAAIQHQLDLREQMQQTTLLISMHSFTPSLRSSPSPRPWHIGFLYNRDARVAEALLNLFKPQTELLAALNQPYSVDDEGDYTIPVHGEKRGIPHVLIEVRNDLIETSAGQTHWAGLLSDAINVLITNEREKLWPMQTI